MKSLFTILSIFLMSQFAIGQSQVWWFDAGVKASYGAAGMLNQSITDSKDYNNDIGSTYAYGGKISANYDNHGFTIDGMLNTGTHKMEDLLLNQDIELKWNTIDVYALYRNNRNITYFEVGPKVSFLSSVDQSNGSATTDVTDYYNPNDISAVIGFGWYAMGNDGAFSGILGLRLEYGVTDFVNDDGATIGAPLPGTFANLDPYNKSNRLSASLVFELNWGIGYFGKAKCGARSKFISF